MKRHVSHVKAAENHEGGKNMCLQCCWKIKTKRNKKTCWPCVEAHFLRYTECFFYNVTRRYRGLTRDISQNLILKKGGRILSRILRRHHKIRRAEWCTPDRGTVFKQQLASRLYNVNKSETKTEATFPKPSEDLGIVRFNREQSLKRDEVQYIRRWNSFH